MKTSAGKVFRAVVGRLFKGRAFPPAFPVSLTGILSSAPDSVPFALLAVAVVSWAAQDKPTSSLQHRFINGEQQ